MSVGTLGEQEALLERLRIESQLHDYWHDVDRNWGRNAATFYTGRQIKIT